MLKFLFKNKGFVFLFILAILAGLFFISRPGWAGTAQVNVTVTIAVCGNGAVEGDEQCDNGSSNGSCPATCSAACTTNSCGGGNNGGGGGGGGGGSAAPSVTTVYFYGRAYPKSAVTLLKDAQIAATTIAGPDAKFTLSISGLAGGNYIFSLYGEDKLGRRSSLFTFPVSVTAGATTSVSGIFIAPTLDVNYSEVKRGDNLAIFGQSAPQSEITIAVNSDEEYFFKAKSDQDGAYLYNFDTSPLEMGQHYTKSKSAVSGEISSFSGSIGFKVGTKSVAKEEIKPAPAVKSDLNNDKRVNLVDFSIAAYWYKRPNPPASADLNNDKKVDLVDFSIMAYYWTG